MKDDLKKLEIKKLLKEFSFLKVDEEYKFEIQGTYGPEFNQAIQNIFKKNPNIDLLFNPENSTPPADNSKKELCKNLLIGIEICASNNIGIDITLHTGYTSDNYNKQSIEASDEAKKLYRKIATKTHPDKVSIKHLNDIYLKAKIAYESNDLFTLYLICSDIDIDYEFPLDKLTDFKNKVKNLKSSNSYIEQTYLWSWINEEDEEKKKSILLHFISNSYNLNF